jgi:UDPglucose--hexose-1-phosphate uridylyltransferase
VPEWVASCPFCPGNEDRTPAEVARAGGPGRDWLVRAFANRYPILAGADAGLDGERLHGSSASRSQLTGGAHEVVVLTPRHDLALATVGDEQAAMAMRVLRERTHSLVAAGGRYVQVFVNHDPAAGASIDHPHTQLVALDFVPPLLEREAGVLAGDGCVLCGAVREESRPGAPRALLYGDVAAWCPFWSSAPFELLIAPTAHLPRFDDLDRDASTTAQALVAVLACLDVAAGDPAYNLVVHTAPAAARDFHWHIHVRPRISEPGGFELGTGIAVNELAPEEAASALRSAGLGTRSTRLPAAGGQLPTGS